MRGLVDTNVLLDVLGRREPFWPDSARGWTRAEIGSLDAWVSAIRFNNVYIVIQYFSAQHMGAAAIVTRNVGDFPRTGPSALTPAAFLAASL
ncbi:hypothetical protein [Deferrisoma camini]|uniref:hypothetical protein n=1 Tax=Deferrisoma camini TaxID=1035120 RepID=UPI00046D719C|nr:hypothetical protein [Deferrisoma camini]